MRAAILVLLAACTPQLGDTTVSGGDPSDEPAPCPSFGAPEPVALVASPALTEVSGLVRSIEHAGIFWVHNDSGDTARFFAIDTQGAIRGVYLLDDVLAIDWEDLAIRPDDDGHGVLYLGDIGDNAGHRPHGTVHVVAEPRALSGTVDAPTRLQASAMSFTYPDGRHNAETLLVEPDGSLLVLTKASGGVTHIYRLPADLPSPPTGTAHKVGEIVFGVEPLPGDRLLTGGDLSADGRTLVLRTYLRTWLWTLADGEPVEDALLRPPCTAPAPPEGQGEAIGFDPVTPTFWTLSEGVGSTLYRVPVR